MSDDESEYSDVEDEKVSVDEPEEDEKTAVEWKNIGNTHYKKGEYRNAIKMYTRAIHVEPNSNYFNNRAAALMMLQDFEAALKDAVRACSREPGTVKYLERTAKCYSALGRKTDANRTYAEILEIDPANATANRELEAIKQIEKFQKQAEDVASKKQFNNAISLLDMALKLSPSDDLMKLRKAEFCIRVGKTGDAERISAGILRENRSNPEALYVRGTCKYALGDLAAAKEHYSQALRNDPDHARAKEELKRTKKTLALKEEGVAAWKSGNYGDAVRLYTEALARDPDLKDFNAKLYFNRAMALARLGENKNAVDDCSRALEIDERYLKALLKRAKLYIELEQFDASIKDAEAACEMEPGNDDAKSQLRESKLELKKSKRRNYYKILGVTKTADDRAIKKGYRVKAMKYHPDKCGATEGEVKEQAEEKFKVISEAYTVLSDPQKRAAYDNGADLEEINGGGGGGGGGHGMSQHDMFAQMFAQQGGFGGGGFRFG